MIDEEDRRQHQRLPAAAPGEQAEAEQAEADQRPVQDLPARLAHDFARAVRPDPPDLGRDEAGELDRLFGDVVAELLAAHPRQRLVGFQARVAGGGEPGEDLLQPQVLGGGGGEQFRVAGDDLGSDLFRVAVGGQVGAGEEHLAAAGRDRHHPVERDGVADRPGRDDEDDPGQQDRGLGQRPLPVAVDGAGEDDDPEQEGDPEVLGPDHRRGAEQGAGKQPGHRAIPIPRPEDRQHRPGQQRRRQRLAHQHPLVLEQRRIHRHRKRPHQAGDYAE